MANEDPTLPPRTPNTPRKFIGIAVAAVKAHPDRLLMFVLGFVAGAVLL